MRKLTVLCRKLKKLGIDSCVIKHGRGDYTVYWWNCPLGAEFRRSFCSVKECESFLLGLFR